MTSNQTSTEARIVMTDMEPKKTKKRWGCLKLLLFALLAKLMLVGIWLAFNYRPLPAAGQPLVELSTETTRISEPLDTNGDVDYLEAINLRCSADVTNDNNAFVKLVEAVGPLSRNPETSTAVMARLGLEPLPEEGDYLISLETWFQQEVERLNRENNEAWIKSFEEATEDDGLADEDEYPELLDVPRNVDQQLEFATQYPWSIQELPEVEKWRQANEAAMKLVREGVERPQYYYPLVSNGKPAILSADLGYVQAFRTVGRSLQVSAMARLYNDDVDGCIDEVKSLYKLAMHVSRGPTIVEGILGNQLLRSGFDTLISVCASEKTTPAQLKELLQWVEAIDFIDNTSQRVDQAERYMGLDAAVTMARGSDSATDGLSGMENQIGLLSGIVEWPEVLKQLNDYYDRFAEVTRVENLAEFESAWASLEDDMIENEQWVMESRPTTAMLGRKAKGIWIGRMLSGMLMPAVRPLVIAEHTNRAQRDMLRIAIAATSFKKENGDYPDSVDQLVPDLIEAIPVNPFTEQPFGFAITDGSLQIECEQTSAANGNSGDCMVITLRNLTWQQFVDQQQP